MGWWWKSCSCWGPFWNMQQLKTQKSYQEKKRSEPTNICGNQHYSLKQNIVIRKKIVTLCCLFSSSVHCSLGWEISFTTLSWEKMFFQILTKLMVSQLFGQFLQWEKCILVRCPFLCHNKTKRAVLRFVASHKKNMHVLFVIQVSATRVMIWKHIPTGCLKNVHI